MIVTSPTGASFGHIQISKLPNNIAGLQNKNMLRVGPDCKLNRHPT